MSPAATESAAVDVGPARPVADAGFYGMLTATERDRLEERASTRFYQPRYIMMLEGQPAGYVAVLSDGWAKAAFDTADGEAALLRIHGPGDLLGCEAVLEDQSRRESVTALSRCVCLVIPAVQFGDLLGRNPGIARAFGLVMLQRARSADERARVRFDLPVVRLARVLLELAERGGAEGPEGVVIPVELSQDELAGLIGASRSTVARALAQLRRDGLILTGYRNITVADPARLRSAIG